jgi:hypothetical protein
LYLFIYSSSKAPCLEVQPPPPVNDWRFCQPHPQREDECDFPNAGEDPFAGADVDLFKDLFEGLDSDLEDLFVGGEEEADESPQGVKPPETVSPQTFSPPRSSLTE